MGTSDPVTFKSFGFPGKRHGRAVDSLPTVTAQGECLPQLQQQSQQAIIVLNTNFQGLVSLKLLDPAFSRSCCLPSYDEADRDGGADRSVSMMIFVRLSGSL